MSLVFAKPIAASLLIIDSPSDNQLLRYDSATAQLQAAPLTYIGDDGYVGLGGETSPETLIEMTNASPHFTFHCDTESDAADSGMCKILFKREQSNGTETTHAAIYAAHDGSDANQKGYIALCTNATADGDSPTEAMRINNLQYIGIGTDTPGAVCHIYNPTHAVTTLKTEYITTLTNGPASSYFLKSKSSGDMVDGFGGGLVFVIDDTADAENNIATIYGLRDTADNSGALTFNTYDTGVRSEVLRITHDKIVYVQGDLKLEPDSSAYLFTDRGADLAIQNQSSSAVSGLEIYAGDGDGTDDVTVQCWGVGTPAAITNRERLWIGWDASESEYAIWTEANGTGTLRSLDIYTEGNQYQMVLATSGNVGINDSAPAEKLDVDGNTNVTGVYKVADTQVVGAQQAHIADAGVGTEIATINAILAALETHGLLASA